MNKVNIKIFKREFELPVSYECYDSEEIKDYQKDALESFLKHQEILENIPNDLINYLKKDNPQKFKDKKIDNIFKYIMPDKLYVGRNSKKRVVTLLCDYKFDLEHGIALMFENEKLVKIATQDIIL